MIEKLSGSQEGVFSMGVVGWLPGCLASWLVGWLVGWVEMI